ncbi:MAG: DUF4174 domain-containing protein [Pikeienuella sp.]|uniref:DUF4174 domain-containing protein n=1 Tax=Pikeienuella sp. TaxID=2831957 RepID=UPI003918721B
MQIVPLRAALAACLLLAGLAAASAEEDPLAAYLWAARPVVVFADSALDPRFQDQMRDLESRAEGLAARDVVVLSDTDPTAQGPLRLKLRPRGFQVVLIDKDGRVIQRSPHTTRADALIRAIDRTPLRRQEVDERRGLGG